MKNRLIAVTDLGTLKIYRVHKDEFSSHPRLDLVDSLDTAAEEKLSNLVTDQAGRFPKGTGAPNGTGAPGRTGDMSAGERHNLKQEQERRAMRKIAEKLSQILEAQAVDGCFFAAPKEINRQLVEEMSNAARAKIEKNVPSNLTKIDKNDLLKHFES